jgi:hypothetical protein
MTDNVTFRDSKEAFADAIASRHLSGDPYNAKWAGHYMYMYTQGTLDHFKHRDTRRYLAVENDRT